ncbi:chemotaxis protein CheW [Stutzerimonas azotifigens]|uniref:chemotaxis protein CheW n=1 Tax=Stutzerimonas azotifigens TaxID=291995 RepID=UPI00048927C1|nr:chemotaxis protein CheW [Stutzerimonas azotifigens]
MPWWSVVPFTIANQRFAVPVENVLKVLPALLSTPLPGAPDTVIGLVDIRGQILPVIDLCRRFGWPSVPRSLWQPLIWLKTSRRELLLSVETVGAVLACEQEAFAPASDPNVPSVLLRGVMRSAEGMLLIQDVEQLLSSVEEQRLAEALAKNGGARDESV